LTKARVLTTLQINIKKQLDISTHIIKSQITGGSLWRTFQDIALE